MYRSLAGSALPGFFYDAWTRGGPDWERVRAPANECSRIPREFLEEERHTMGERWFRQEYLCEFVDSVSGVFERDLVERATGRLGDTATRRHGVAAC